MVGRWWGRTLAFGLAMMSAQTVRADELKPPQNVNAEPGNRPSSELGSRSASASMQGQPQEALNLANQAIRADPRNPWPYYNKGMALAALGETDGAIAALYAADKHFAPTDRWARSLTIYGRAHTLSRAGRCVEAVQAFGEYANFVMREDPRSAEMARRYAMNCQTQQQAAAAAATPVPPPSEFNEQRWPSR